MLYSESTPFTPFVEAKALTHIPHCAGGVGQTLGLIHRIVCNGCMMVWSDGGGMGCRGGITEMPAQTAPSILFDGNTMNVLL
jgi:hypothetical protein